MQELEGFGKKSIENLLEAIENSKKNSLERLIFALGIRHVGKKTASILASYYKNMDSLMNASLEDLMNITDIGDKIALSIKEYFNDNIELINNLKSLGINMNYIGKEKKENELIKNKTFVLTGTLEKLTRNDAKELIEQNGGNVTNSVSKKTDVVVVGLSPGSKYDKAQEIGISIWDEIEFIKNVGGI